jgi:predicted helicase
MEAYAEFRNICFVDTLDNTDALHYKDKQDMLFGISSENAKRIKDQNAKKISVIIGNPPYNANQANFNDFNKNRGYDEIDRRIKDTYVKHSTAQKTKVYDMYARFYRWSMDRVDKNGIIAFITNRSFIDSRTFDGFRKTVEDEFDVAYIVDTRSDIRANPKIAGTTHNVFGIQTGVAIMFLVKKQAEDKRDKRKCKIFYTSFDDFWRKQEKLDWLRDNPIEKIQFESITPDEKHNWINQTDNNFETLLPLADKEVKRDKAEEAIFRLFSNGIITARDEWVHDLDKINLEAKVSFFINEYKKDSKKHKQNPKEEIENSTVKYTSEIIEHIKRKSNLEFNNNNIRISTYRPFVEKLTYYDKIITHRLYQQDSIFPLRTNHQNKLIMFVSGNRLDFSCFATKHLPNYALYSLDPMQCLPLYFYKDNQKHENITDWGLTQLQTHYKASNGAKITKQDIFYYTYAVLHSPIYRKKYEQNLKREFPRLPFYEDFFKWRDWGKELMDLHINYETQEPFALERKDLDSTAKKKIKQNDLFNDQTKTEDKPFVVKPKTKLRADKESGTIEIDSHTTLTGIPQLAWGYKLGNRSALEWILDQYKEKNPQDTTIAERFNNYKFEDYKEQVIDLLKRVANVSVKTMEIINQMPDEPL